MLEKQVPTKKCVGGAEKVIKIDGVIIVDEIVQPIEKSAKYNRIQSKNSLLYLNWMVYDVTQSSIINHKIFLSFEIIVFAMHRIIPAFLHLFGFRFRCKFSNLISMLTMSKKIQRITLSIEHHIINILKRHLNLPRMYCIVYKTICRLFNSICRTKLNGKRNPKRRK